MATNLLDWIADLLRDPDARESFFDRPDHYARDHGFDHLSPHDVHDSLQLLADDGFPSPRHFSHGDHHGDHAGAHYLRSYFHENRAFIDSRDTDINDRIHQDIDTGGHGHHGHDHGGDFHQTIDNDPVVASGDHSVATGGDIQDSFVTSGRGNVIGDHDHVVSGSGGTTAFGTGDADSSSFDGARFGDGAAVSVGGNATGHSEHNSTSSSVHGGHGPTSVNVAGAEGNATEYADQHENESSVHSDFDDHGRSDDHSSDNSHNRAEGHDSHDFDLHT